MKRRITVGELMLVQTTAEMVRQSGAVAFTLRWSSPFVGESEEDAPEGVECGWTATAEYCDDQGMPPHAECVRTRKVQGHSPVGTDHPKLGALACAELLRALGANVTLIDAGDVVIEETSRRADP